MCDDAGFRSKIVVMQYLIWFGNVLKALRVSEYSTTSSTSTMMPRLDQPRVRYPYLLSILLFTSTSLPANCANRILRVIGP
jgi:hypothetical protein